VNGLVLLVPPVPYRYGREADREEQARLVEAIDGGAHIAALTLALKGREQRRTQLQHELDVLGAREHLAAFDSAGVARDLHRRVNEWRDLVQRNTPSRAKCSTGY